MKTRASIMFSFPFDSNKIFMQAHTLIVPGQETLRVCLQVSVFIDVQMLITDIVDVLDLYDYGCPFSQKLPSSTLVGKRVAVSIESTLLLVASRRNGHGQNSKTYVKILVF